MSKCAVMIIEDDPSILEVMRAILGLEHFTERFEVQCFSGSKTALPFAHVNGQDVLAVFVDYTLYGENGRDILGILKPHCQKATFILMSGGVQAMSSEMLSGFSKVLPKPFSLSSLHAMINEVLEEGETQHAECTTDYR